LTLLFDENFPPYLPEALRLFGYDAKHVLDDHSKGIEDTALFAEIGLNGWTWISHDKGIRRKPHERRAMQDAGIGAFIITGRSHRSARQMMIFIMQHIEELLRLDENTTRPFVIGLSDRGKFEVLK